MKKNKKKETENIFLKRNLAYTLVIVIIVILLIIIVFRHTYPTIPTPKAAIIDQLGSPLLEEAIRYKNQTFITITKRLLYKKFSIVDYYSDNATLEEYKNLANKGYKLIIWRTHSALDRDQKFVAISISEKYKPEKYPTYVNNGQLGRCNISGYYYFGITPKFVKEIMSGHFEDTVIILMSCNGLRENYYQTAKAFKEKGVKAFISWDDWILPEDNDNSIELLLRYLIIENWTIGKAVDEIPRSDSVVGSAMLRYYPTTFEVKNYVIPNYKEANLPSSSWLNILVTKIIDKFKFVYN
jgi:competence protein ComGC